MSTNSGNWKQIMQNHVSGMANPEHDTVNFLNKVSIGVRLLGKACDAQKNELKFKKPLNRRAKYWRGVCVKNITKFNKIMPPIPAFDLSFGNK